MDSLLNIRFQHCLWFIRLVCDQKGLWHWLLFGCCMSFQCDWWFYICLSVTEILIFRCFLLFMRCVHPNKSGMVISSMNLIHKSRECCYLGTDCLFIKFSMEKIRPSSIWFSEKVFKRAFGWLKLLLYAGLLCKLMLWKKNKH